MQIGTLDSTRWSRDEVAEWLGISLRLVDGLIVDGDIETKRVGKFVWVSQEALEDFLFRVSDGRFRTVDRGKPLLSKSNTASLLRISLRLVDQLLAADELHAIRIGVKRVLIHPDDVAELVKRATESGVMLSRPPTSAAPGMS